MNYNYLIIVLVVILGIVVVGGVFFISNNNQTPEVNNTVANNTPSANVSVDKVNSEEVSSQSSDNTHLVLASDGMYYICDDYGNFLESLGPSKKYYPNDPSAVEYPDAESYQKYMQYQL